VTALPSDTRVEWPPEPGFARREARFGRMCSAQKKGVHGGNMVSPVLEWVRIPVAGILRLLEDAE